MDFFISVVNENVDLVDQGRLFSLAQNLNSNNSINDSTFVRNLGYTGFQPHEIDITNALSMVSNTNNSVLLFICNKSSI